MLSHDHDHDHQQRQRQRQRQRDLGETRRSRGSKGLGGLLVCVLLSIGSVYRESFDTKTAIRDTKAFFSDNTFSLPIGIGLGIGIGTGVQQHGFGDDAPALVPFYGVQTGSQTGSGRSSRSNNATTTQGITGTEHAPRVIVVDTRILDASFAFPSASASASASAAVLENMIYLSGDRNPLSKNKESSAAARDRSSDTTIRFVGLGRHGSDEDVNVNVDVDVDMEERTLELPPDAFATARDGGERAYRQFERDWYENCIPVTNRDEDEKKKKNDDKTEPHDTSRTSMLRPTCNSFHEMDLVEGCAVGNAHDNAGAGVHHRLELLGQGSWRSVWRVLSPPQPEPTARTPAENEPSREKRTDYDNRNGLGLDDNGHGSSSSSNNSSNRSSIVLKLLHTHHAFDENSYSIHQLDAIVMESLSASGYVVDSYGFCGQSVLTNAALESGRSFIKRKEHKWVDRLGMARDLARGLADLHALAPHRYHAISSSGSSRSKSKSNSGHPTALPLVFAHHDVNPANVIAVPPGQLQWNDFNLGLVNRYDPTSSSSSSSLSSSVSSERTECPVPIRYEQLLWRSPEECRNETGTLLLTKDGSGRNSAAQAADVYSLGNILFYILTRHQPWSHLEEEGHDNDNDNNNDNNNDSNNHNNDNNDNSHNKNSTLAKLDTGSTAQNKRDSLVSIGRAKAGGRLPNLPEKYLGNSAEARALWDTIRMCYEHDPARRPTALEIANHLNDAHERFLGLRKRPSKEDRTKQ